MGQAAAIAIDGRNAIYFANRASAYIKLEDYAEAVFDAEQAIDIERSRIRDQRIGDLQLTPS
jgi:hypothetical protein